MVSQFRLGWPSFQDSGDQIGWIWIPMFITYRFWKSLYPFSIERPPVAEPCRFVRYLSEGYADVFYLPFFSLFRRLPARTMGHWRLELCAALLLARVFQSIYPLHTNIPMSPTWLFTDSEKLIHWLSTPSHLLSPCYTRQRIGCRHYMGSRKNHWHLRGSAVPQSMFFQIDGTFLTTPTEMWSPPFQGRPESLRTVTIQKFSTVGVVTNNPNIDSFFNHLHQPNFR